MNTTIQPIRGPSIPAMDTLPAVKPGGNSGLSSFPDLLSKGITIVEQARQNADDAAARFLAGQNEDLHTVAIAEQKAELTTDLFLQLRNKAVSAYQEIMRMQL